MGDVTVGSVVTAALDVYDATGWKRLAHAGQAGTVTGLGRIDCGSGGWDTAVVAYPAGSAELPRDVLTVVK
jgi:hypothetical protein